jgi:hypothetical protein
MSTLINGLALLLHGVLAALIGYDLVLLRRRGKAPSPNTRHRLLLSVGFILTLSGVRWRHSLGDWDILLILAGTVCIFQSSLHLRDAPSPWRSTWRGRPTRKESL